VKTKKYIANKGNTYRDVAEHKFHFHFHLSRKRETSQSAGRLDKWATNKLRQTSLVLDVLVLVPIHCPHFPFRQKKKIPLIHMMPKTPFPPTRQRLLTFPLRLFQSTFIKRNSLQPIRLREFLIWLLNFGITCSVTKSLPKHSTDWSQMVSNAYLSLDCANNKSINDNRLVRLLSPLHKIQQLNLSSCNALEGESLKDVNLSQLKVLKICHSHISQKGFRNVLSLSSLVILNLAYTNLSYKRDWSRIVCLTRLEVLDLTSCKVHNEALSFIGCLSSLKELYLESCSDVRDEGVLCLTSLKELEVLDLINCCKVTDRGICAVARNLSKLQQLYLLRCSNITDVGIDMITTLPRLRKLDLGKCRGITNAALRNFSRLSTLTSLSLFKCTSIDELGFGSLTSLSSMHALDIGFTNISPISQTQLIKMSKLRYLYAEKCPVFAFNTSAFRWLTNIAELHISYLNDYTVTTLRLLNDLEKLHLSGDITDAGLEDSLTSLSCLKELSFANLDLVTNHALKVVAKLSSLQNFSLIGCQKVTVAGVAHLSSLRRLHNLFINNSNITTNKMQVLKLYLVLPANVKITIIDQ
jgi:hypothetical protein